MRLREVKCPAQGHTHTAGKRQRLHVPHICLLPGARILPPGSSCLCSSTEDPLPPQTNPCPLILCSPRMEEERSLPGLLSQTCCPGTPVWPLSSMTFLSLNFPIRKMDPWQRFVLRIQ